MAENNKADLKTDSAQVIDFVEKFKSQKELQEYAKAQFITLLQTNKRINALEKENSSLKSLLEQSRNLPSDTKVIPKSSEEITCEMEIAKMHQASMQRELDLNEVRKLEILVKTLYSAKTKSLESIPIKKIEADESELIRLASNNQED